MVRRTLLLLAFLGCHSDSSGRVVIEQRDDTLVIRDTTRVVEIDLTRSTGTLHMAPDDSPDARMPGRVVLDDLNNNRAVLVWITRLGDRRPESIETWFDEKVEGAKRESTIMSNRRDTFSGHAARVVNWVFHGVERDTYQRFIGVDIPEHDLEVVLLAVLYKDAAPGEEAISVSGTTAEQKHWLEGLVEDVRGIKISPPPAKPAP